MARKPRIQYPGAVYHILSRGDHRQKIFNEVSTATAFEKAIIETAQRCSWRIHAYVIMANHYHMLVETPEGNLVEGMQWLQGTFGNRYNRCHQTQGHVFQGRYKSLLVESGSYFLGLADYIHLNPVRAGLISIDQLRNYLHSSFPKFMHRTPLQVLCRKVFLAEANLPDSVFGMKKYHLRLANLDEADPSKSVELRKKFLNGLVIGSENFRREIFSEFNKMQIRKDWGGEELLQMNQEKWELEIQALLEKEGKTEKEIEEDKKCAEWKIRIAKKMRKWTSVSNPWLAKRLRMGHPTAVSKMISLKY